MEQLISQVQIKVSEKIFLKDPMSSKLGMEIISHSIPMILELGMEHFTFKKLASKVSTTESSVYRYFENKHKLLIYLSSWYWSFMEYQLVFLTTNVRSAEQRLITGISLMCKDNFGDEVIQGMPIGDLNKIIISESSKAYLVKEVDQVNKTGAFVSYKNFVNRLSDISLEINPEFQHPHSLVSTIAEGIHHQKYFAEHLPALADSRGEKSLSNFFTQLALSTLKNHVS